MKKPRVFFRTDGNEKIGLGHFSRCLAIAFMLREKFDCLFVVTHSANQVFNILRENNFLWLCLQSENLLQEAVEFSLQVNTEEIVVIDGYQFNEEYCFELKRKSAKLVLIDDFYKSFSCVDAVLNYAPETKLNSYVKQSNTRYFLGADYALLRPLFLHLAKEKRNITHAQNIFICFGGADAENCTLKVLKSLALLNYNFSIHLVLASTFPHTKEVKTYVQNSSLKTTLHINLNEKEMAQLMCSCDLAIAPTSIIAYEICAVGMGFLGGYFTQNQKAIHDGFLHRSCLLSVGNFLTVKESEVAHELKKLIDDINTIRTQVNNQKKIINGKSDEKVRAIFSTL